MRVDTGGGEQPARMLACQFDGAARAILARAGDDHLAHADGGGALHDGLAIGVETVVGEVDADIDEIHRRGL